MAMRVGNGRLEPFKRAGAVSADPRSPGGLLLHFVSAIDISLLSVESKCDNFAANMNPVRGSCGPSGCPTTGRRTIWQQPFCRRMVDAATILQLDQKLSSILPHNSALAQSI